jgi:hypothetical protein
MLELNIGLENTNKLTLELCAARALHQSTAMDYIKHHATRTYTLILHQLDLTPATRKTPLWQSGANTLFVKSSSQGCYKVG